MYKKIFLFSSVTFSLKHFQYISSPRISWILTEFWLIFGCILTVIWMNFNCIVTQFYLNFNCISKKGLNLQNFLHKSVKAYFIVPVKLSDYMRSSCNSSLRVGVWPLYSSSARTRQELACFGLEQQLELCRTSPASGRHTSRSKSCSSDNVRMKQGASEKRTIFSNILLEASSASVAF